MTELDLVVRGGTVVTEAGQFRADVGISAGRIAALGNGLEGARTIDAGGLL
ncbi:MAG: dihydropyrimidinase, partial [Acetobacteraceae bacterium]|nr:dihydropyrimidinase [Acetobacteraceae bacterium]